MFKKIYTTALVLAFAQMSFAAWDGTAKLPKVVSGAYEITSPEELIGFLESVTTSNRADETLRAYLKNDIVFGADTSTLATKRWTTTKRNEYFVGDFDGRGHTVYGLNAEQALFDVVGTSAGSIHDLNVANSSFGSDTAGYAAAVVTELHAGLWNVNVYNTDVRAVYYAGGIAANMSSPADDQIAYILNGNVVGGSVKAGGYVGGIVGYAAGRVAGCSNSAKVSFADAEGSTKDSEAYIGGIVGYADGTDGTAVENSVNRGEVELKTVNGNIYVGGIVGFVLGNVSNLQNYGKVLADISYAGENFSETSKVNVYVGGVAGTKHFRKNEYGEIRDFVNEGEVELLAKTQGWDENFLVGGIFGENRVQFRNAMNKGAINVKIKTLSDYTRTKVGGIAGFAAIRIDTLGIERLANRGDVNVESSGRVYVGGLMGELERRSSDMLVLSRSFNYGNVTGTIPEDAVSAEALEVGGLVGNCLAHVIDDVYNRGAVIAKGKLVEGATHAGGLFGSYAYSETPVHNSYSAAPYIRGDDIGGIIGDLEGVALPVNTYFDSVLADIGAIGFARYGSSLKVCDGCAKSTKQLQSDETLTMLNTANGKVADRKIWVRRGGYPVLTFDSLYMNDSAYSDIQHYAMPPSVVDNDTVVYTISTAEQLATFLTMRSLFVAPGFGGIRVQLANDIVMGKDSVHLPTRLMSIDTVGKCMDIDFDGQGHTIYGLNMSRAMFNCIAQKAAARNFTIANSRFENELELPVAGVAIRNGGTIVNVNIRNSLVHGGHAGGLVVYNYDQNTGVILSSKNENTTVIACNYCSAGGIAVTSAGVLSDLSNSGRVSGDVVGGIVGTTFSLAQGASNLVSTCSNTGKVLSYVKKNFSLAGGIVGVAQATTISNNFNSGLVEVSSDQFVYVGGIVGWIDSSGSVTNSGNWGRVHALSGEKVWAGGLVGYVEGQIMYTDDTYFIVTTLANDFNYGPVHVKSASVKSYVGGLVGEGKGFLLQKVYNRGGVINEVDIDSSMTGGFVGAADSSIIRNVYSYVDTLYGKNVANIIYRVSGSRTFKEAFYGSNWGDIPAFVREETAASDQDSLIEMLSFEEMMYPSITQVSKTFADADWVDKGCMPVAQSDTTSTCAASVVKDFFGDVNEPYTVGYVVTSVKADSSVGENNEVPVLVDPKTVDPKTVDPKPVSPKVKPLPMLVEVSARGVAVYGLMENSPVLVFNMKGRLVASARIHGGQANLSVPRAGRYLVRSGKFSRLVNIR